VGPLNSFAGNPAQNFVQDISALRAQR